MNFLVPQGIGDAIWALTKIEDANRKLGGGPLRVKIACFFPDEAEARALDFISRFRFVDSAEMYVMPRNEQTGPVLLPGPPTDSNGLYRYLPNGKTDLKDIDFVLMPNAPLERGERLETWLPEFDIRWNIMDDFSFLSTEIVHVFTKPYAVFYCGSLTGNTTDGHNRNSIWTPVQWAELGERLHSEYGLDIVIVGAEYDSSYYETQILPLLQNPWINFIGILSIGRTLFVAKQSKCVISYQSGIGVASSYLGIPTGMFWRAKGDSVSPNGYVSFEETMASTWVNPSMLEKCTYLPLIYGRHDVDCIMKAIEERKWIS